MVTRGVNLTWKHDFQLNFDVGESRIAPPFSEKPKISPWAISFRPPSEFCVCYWKFGKWRGYARFSVVKIHLKIMLSSQIDASGHHISTWKSCLAMFFNEICHNLIQKMWHEAQKATNDSAKSQNFRLWNRLLWRPVGPYIGRGW